MPFLAKSLIPNCDDPACEVVVDEQGIIRLNCGHTFHRGCFFKNSSDEEHSYALPREEMKCAVCYEPLCERMEELATLLSRLVYLIITIKEKSKWAKYSVI